MNSKSQVKNLFLILEAQTMLLLEKKLNGDSRFIKEIIAEENYSFVLDRNELERICVKVLKDNPAIVDEILNKRKDRKIQFLVGIVLKEARFDPRVVSEALDRLIKS